jgi:hypothetical protein
MCRLTAGKSIQIRQDGSPPTHEKHYQNTHFFLSRAKIYCGLNQGSSINKIKDNFFSICLLIYYNKMNTIYKRINVFVVVFFNVFVLVLYAKQQQKNRHFIYVVNPL